MSESTDNAPADTPPSPVPAPVPSPSGGLGTQATAGSGAGGVKVLFGLAININGKPVSVTTDNVADIRVNGIEFGLPDPVELGMISDARTFLQTEYGVSTDFLDNLPGPLSTVATKLEQLDFTVEKLHVKIPGTANPGPPLYTLAMSALWPESQAIHLADQLQVEGVVFGITNEPQAAGGTTGASRPPA